MVLMATKSIKQCSASSIEIRRNFGDFIFPINKLQAFLVGYNNDNSFLSIE